MLNNEQKQSIEQLYNQRLTYNQIAESVGCTNRQVRFYCQKYLNRYENIQEKENQHGTYDEREQHFIKSFHDRFPGFKYSHGFINIDEMFYCTCKKCEATLYRSAQCIRRSAPIRCDGCVEMAKQAKEIETLTYRYTTKLQNALKRVKAKEEAIIPKVCKQCGEKFINSSRSRYCSNECRIKANNRTNEVKRRHTIRKNGKIDWDISLDKLYKKYKGVCHICGRQCDYNDYTTQEDTFIAGDGYPSIDHVKPVSKGGTHTWDNVKLAHRRCNYMKNDMDVYEGSGGQLRLSV